jgi:hypothetical protein
MFDKTIEDIVKENVTFLDNAKEWTKCSCPLCNDGKSHNPRGGWLFNDEMASYNCFNCGTKGTFDPNREYAFSKDMKHILEGFNVPLSECYAIIFSKNDNKKIKPSIPKVVVSTLEMPKYFYKLEDGNPENIIVQKAYAELSRRNIDPASYPFYLSNGITKDGPRHEAIAKAMMNRLIIPFFNADNELIFYQGRSLDKQSTMKYLNADVPRGNIIYGMDRLHSDINKPLFVCEGFFDAFHLKGVSLQENNITTGQIELLKKSPRKKVWVPDKGSDSSRVVDAFCKLNWHIAVPEFGSSCKDVDDSIRKYGKLHTVQQIMSNIYDCEFAKTLLIMNGFLIKSKNNKFIK